MKLKFIKDKRIVLAGNRLEIYDRFLPVDTPKKYTAGLTPKNDIARSGYQASWYARQAFTKLVLSNLTAHGQIPKFITLTFSKNVQDLKIANSIFHKFIQRFNYHYGYQLKYICVPEFQKKGRVHYHLLAFNMPFVDPKTDFFLIKDMWGGRIKIQKADEGAIPYLAKYMSKSFLDVRLKGRKRYFRSDGLYPPIVRDSGAVAHLLMPYLLEIGIFKQWVTNPKYSQSSEHLLFNIPPARLAFIQEKLMGYSREVSFFLKSKKLGNLGLRVG
jgi:hypothetical protein